MADEMNSGVLHRVRIPSNLKSDLDQYFSCLKLQVLEEAIRRAGARTKTDEVCVLQKDDLLTSAQEAFTEAAIGLIKALSPDEPNNVRRAS